MLDAFMDASQVKQDIAAFAAEGSATRCEYLGGHPQLPASRLSLSERADHARREEDKFVVPPGR